MAKGNRVGEHDSEESDEEYKVTEDEDFDESDEDYSLDSDESEELLEELEESKKVSRSRSTRGTSLGRKGDEMSKPRKKRRVCYTVDEDEDDDDDEEVDEEDDGELVSLGCKANRIKKPREKKRVSYREVDDEEEDYAEFVSMGRKRNHRKKPEEKKRILHTDEDEDAAATLEEDDDDEKFMNSGRKEIQKKRLREKRKVSYKEDEEEDDSVFISTSRKRNQIYEPREKRIVSYKEDNEEEDEEKEAEVKLSGSNFVDDEDTIPNIKKNEKVMSHHPPKKNIRREQKSSKKSKIKKPTILKQGSHRFGQKVSSSKERPITYKKQVETRSKKSSKRLKQRAKAVSDSDFISSASSDHEYTISEEERELLREASVYCANLREKLPGKGEEEPASGQRKNPAPKGKEKVEDMNDELGKQVCGICLSEEGKRTVRGVLNCCRHHFCFSCIMEWSKVESRCPICKQRFSTITKAAKSDTGFDLRTVVIPVPECDQVYQPSEEELRGYLDPYESVICTECHNGGEDALMLLCDICDSAAHTFCVGLGREVSEGNWYCEGCRPTVFGSLNSQHLTSTLDRRLSSNASDQSSHFVGGFDLNELYVPETPLMEQTQFLPDCNPAHAGMVATTLRDRRRIHRQIHTRFLNNNGMSDLVSRSSGTSSSPGIRLFGSRLDQARDSIPQMAAHPHELSNGREDQIMHPLHDDTSRFPPRVDQISVRVQNSNLASVDVSLQAEINGSGMTLDSRFGFAQLHPCTTNRSSISSDAIPSPYACREVIGPSRTSEGPYGPY